MGLGLDEDKSKEELQGRQRGEDKGNVKHSPWFKFPHFPLSSNKKL